MEKITHQKRIIIISKLIFPYQSPRSFRATELAKELARYGHDVTLYGALGRHSYKNFEKQNRLKIRDIGRTFFLDKNSEGIIRRNNFIQFIAKLLDKPLELINIGLTFKVAKILREHQDIDILITIASPHTIHWGAALAKTLNKRTFPKTWIADCGDPYIGNLIFKPLFYFKYVEKWFCEKADYITVPIENARKAYFPEFYGKIKVIPQGFRLVDTKVKLQYIPNRTLTFIYAGVFYPKNRNPSQFIEYLEKIDTNFQFIIYTKTDKILQKYKNRLPGKLYIRGFIPRPELIQVLSTADFLVNFENGTDVHLPSKLIDYKIAQRPILSVDCKKLDKDVINEFLNRNYTHQMIVDDMGKFDIENVAKMFLSLG